MRKRFAVFISAISLENQQKNVMGILNAAKREGVRIFIFTCHLNFMARVETQEGTYNIMRLPDLSTFDGAIIMKNTIQYQPAADELEERLLSSGIPCVSIDQEIEGMQSVMMDNYHAEYEVVSHMVEVHGCRKLCFVAGYPGNRDGEERKKGYLDACWDFRIRAEDAEVIDGNYSIDSGRQAAESVLKRGSGLPDAFLCANDQMAIGVIQRLAEEGIRVPEDIAVTGFDADGVGDAYNPMLTTMYKGQEKAGELAVLMLLGKKKKDQYILQGKLEVGRSCGCDVSTSKRGRALRGQFVSQSIMIRQASDFIRNMSSDFAEAEQLPMLYDLLKAYIHVGDMKSCYLCLCKEEKVFHRVNIRDIDHLDLTDVNTRFTETSFCPVAYRDGKFIDIPNFTTGRVISEEQEELDNADYYVVAPVNYRNCCFGYMLISNSVFATQSDLFFSWISNVSIALENIRKHIIMQSMLDRLNEMWVYDSMTKLYNRAGFYHLADEYFLELQRRNASGYIIFIDLDGLKTVNDTLGHEMGDAYIRAMGDVLRNVKKPTDLAMRYGGDEFVLFGECENRDAAENAVRQIEEEMKNYVFGEQSYVLSASIGCTFARMWDVPDLHSAIHEADEKMYALKRGKRAAAKTSVQEQKAAEATGGNV